MKRLVLIKNINILATESEKILYNYYLLIEDEKIEEILPAGQMRRLLNDKLPEISQLNIFDGTDKYILPGLMDKHVHIWKKEEMLLFLANGLTTVMDMWGTPRHIKWQLQYLTTDELVDYFKNLLIKFPDSSSNELLTNIDSAMNGFLDQTRLLQGLLNNQFDLCLENWEKIQGYLVNKLGAFDFEKIQHLWISYRRKEVSCKAFIQESTTVLGVKFSRIFTDVRFLMSYTDLYDPC